MRRKNKEEQYKIYKTTIIIVLILLVAFVFKLLVLLFSKSIDGFAYKYLIQIYNPINTFLFRLFQYTPFLGNYITVILSLSCGIFCIVVTVLLSMKTIRVKAKEKMFNYVIVIVSFICTLTFITTMDNNVLLNVETLDRIYMADKADTEYDVDDLIQLNSYFKDKVLYYANNLERDNTRVIFNDDITKASVNSLENISNDYEFLKGKYPSKIRDFTTVFRNNNDDGTVGFTLGYGIAMDYSYEKVNLIMTATHELCHMKGLVRENETVFCQTIANMKYDNDVVKYAGYLEAFNRTTYALRKVAKNTADEIGDEVEELCLTKGYQEICELHRKDIKNYINGSDKLYITTYRLEDYYEYKDNFYKFMNILLNDYNAKMYNDNKDEMSYEELMYNIDNNDSGSILIELDIDHLTFNSLQSTLDEYSNYYRSLYQQDSSEPEEEEKTVEEATHYYLDPFDNNKKLIYNLINVTSEYDYERVTRLYLEYYDKYGY